MAAVSSRRKAPLALPRPPLVVGKPRWRWPCPGWLPAVPCPSGCQMGLVRGCQAWALAPAPSPPEGPGGARRRARQAADGGPGGGAARADGPTVRTDGGLGRGPEPPHLLQAPGGAFLIRLGLDWEETWACSRPAGSFLPQGSGLGVPASGSCSPPPAAGAGPPVTELEGFPRVGEGEPGRACGTRGMPRGSRDRQMVGVLLSSTVSPLRRRGPGMGVNAGGAGLLLRRTGG